MFLACNAAAQSQGLAAKLYEEELRKKRAAAAAAPKRKQAWFKPGSPEALAAAEAAKNEGSTSSDTSELGNSSRSNKSSEFFTRVKTPDRDMYWMINQERMARNMEPFRKSILLERLAQNVVNELCWEKRLTPTEYHGNIGCGMSREHIHKTIMSDSKGTSRGNVLNGSFTECGSAETIGEGRQIYSVTLFN